ncbi:dihydrodipicolinate synthase family protein [Sphingomonas sp.]|uniref:dihydrodipicolinate synthase family protein n=1 Tax=Sphingomonas sp. TaxID=28214 RepID=UPI0026301FD7|nr:dihydrodipicolinate synthase family protein [Sphingomonas sp.]
MKKFRGSYTVAVTPFSADSATIDYGALRSFLDWQLECRVPGIIMLGTTGEFLTISREERRALVAETVKHVGGRMDVLVGTMDAYTPNAVAYSAEAQALGADGLMIIPPYYYTPTDDEIFEYYRAICAAVTVPIMVYNNPVTSNRDMSAALIAKLTHSFEQVRYIKEASMDVARVYDIVEETGGVMNVFAGERPVESFLLGAVGYVNPYGNYLPYATTRLWELLEQGRIRDAAAIQHLVHRADRIIAEGHPTYGHQCYSKALAGAMGHPVGDVRQPLTTFASLGDEGKQKLAAILAIFEEIDALMKDIDARTSDAVETAA